MKSLNLNIRSSAWSSSSLVIFFKYQLEIKTEIYFFVKRQNDREQKSSTPSQIGLSVFPIVYFILTSGKLKLKVDE